MLTALDDAAVFHNKNQVRAANGGQAMRDHKGRAAFHQVVQGLLDRFLRLRVNRGGRVIQDKDAGVHQQGAGDGHPLALTAAERHTALTDDGLITVGEVEDKLMRLRSLRGGDDFLVAGLRPAVSDVGLDRVGEKERGLQDDADPAAQRVEIYRADVHAVHEHCALGHIIEARDQVDQRGFPGTGLSDQGDDLVRLDGEVDVVQGE